LLIVNKIVYMFLILNAIMSYYKHYYVFACRFVVGWAEYGVYFFFNMFTGK
jgi:hypothetical protein